jgi:hypothetical protein
MSEIFVIVSYCEMHLKTTFDFKTTIKNKLTELMIQYVLVMLRNLEVFYHISMGTEP